jgi:hypothetical protein
MGGPEGPGKMMGPKSGPGPVGPGGMYPGGPGFLPPGHPIMMEMQALHQHMQQLYSQPQNKQKAEMVSLIFTSLMRISYPYILKYYSSLYPLVIINLISK